MKAKIKTLVIAPYRGLVELTTSLMNDLQDFDITVKQSDLSEVLPMIGNMEKEGYDLIISRGGTAKLLRKHSSLPVIDIHVSGYDILRTLVLVKDYKVKMEIIGFANIIDGFVSVSSMLNINIPVTVTSNEDEVNNALARARDNGVKIVLGDNSTVAKTANYGIQGVLITSGKEAVLEAFAQAKHIHHIARSYYAVNEAYENLIHSLDVGISVIDKHGVPQFANHAFRSMFKLPPERKDGSLFGCFPFFRQMIEDMDLGIVFDARTTVMDPGKKFAIEGGKIAYSHNKEHYYIKATEARMSERELVVVYWDDPVDSFPPLLVEGRDAAGQTVYPELSQFEYPLALYGENGSGRRLFASAVRRRTNDHMLELDISNISDSSVEMISRLVRSPYKNTIAYVHGLEKADPSFQMPLYNALSESSAKVIFALGKEPKAMADSGALDRRLYDQVKHHTIFIPSLRERTQDLEGLIKSFIIQYNARYGKQIVGVRPEALSALSSYEWPGNLIELQETMKQLVKQTDGQYIGEDVLPIRPKDHKGPKDDGTEHPAGQTINLNQTLDEIERDIIMTVLEEEQMNQTRAAKRLGINRSTLWRKIKQGEE